MIYAHYFLKKFKKKARNTKRYILTLYLIDTYRRQFSRSSLSDVDDLHAPRKKINNKQNSAKKEKKPPKNISWIGGKSSSFLRHIPRFPLYSVSTSSVRVQCKWLLWRLQAGWCTAHCVRQWCGVSCGHPSGHTTCDVCGYVWDWQEEWWW